MHPSLQHPILTAVQPMYADISYYEQHPGFSEIRRHILGSVHAVCVCNLELHFAILSARNFMHKMT